VFFGAYLVPTHPLKSEQILGTLSFNNLNNNKKLNKNFLIKKKLLLLLSSIRIRKAHSSIIDCFPDPSFFSKHVCHLSGSLELNV
jgi:hypothetical protein